MICFTGGGTPVDVSVTEDNPTVRDLLGQLPLTLTVEEFSGREKISYLPRELATAGSSGTGPEDGDLIYFTPWGHLGFSTTPSVPGSPTTSSTSAPTGPTRTPSAAWGTPRSVDPGRVFDATYDLDDIAEAYRAMDERRVIKALVKVSER